MCRGHSKNSEGRMLPKDKQDELEQDILLIYNIHNISELVVVPLTKARYKARGRTKVRAIAPHKSKIAKRTPVSLLKSDVYPPRMLADLVVPVGKRMANRPTRHSSPPHRPSRVSDQGCIVG
jgi:hypothetical protein